MIFSCFNCGLITDLKDDMAGRNWRCPACGQAATVPDNDDGPRQPRGFVKVVALILAGLIPGVLLGGAAGYTLGKKDGAAGLVTPGTPNTSPAKGLGEPASFVEAGDMYDEYTTNETDSDRAYKGKVVEVWGVVSQKNSSIGTICVWLRHQERSEINTAVQCHFDLSRADQLNNLAVSQQVRIKGICKGGSKLCVTLDKCELLEPQ